MGSDPKVILDLHRPVRLKASPLRREGVPVAEWLRDPPSQVVAGDLPEEAAMTASVSASTAAHLLQVERIAALERELEALRLSAQAIGASPLKGVDELEAEIERLWAAVRPHQSSASRDA